MVGFWGYDFFVCSGSCGGVACFFWDEFPVVLRFAVFDSGVHLDQRSLDYISLKSLGWPDVWVHDSCYSNLSGLNVALGQLDEVLC